MERLTEFATSIHGVDIDAPEVGSPRGTTAEEEKDTTARALLEEEGFDPDDVRKDDSNGRTPLLYFIAQGNVTMVQYLILREADCRRTDRYGYFPMYVAAAGGHVEILTLLSQVGGARVDIRKHNKFGNSLLCVALFNDHFEVVQWLIMNGALDDVDGGGIDDAIMRKDFWQHTKWDEDKREAILAWARDKVATQEAAHASLTTEATSSFPMTLQFIEHRLQTLRPLIRLLSAFIAEVPFVEEEEEEKDKTEEPNSVSRNGGADTTTNTNNLTNNSNNTRSTSSSSSSSSSIQELPEDDFILDQDEEDEDEEKRIQEEDAVRSSRREEQQRLTRGGDRNKTVVAQEVIPPKPALPRRIPTRSATATIAIRDDARRTTTVAQEVTSPKPAPPRRKSQTRSATTTTAIRIDDRRETAVAQEVTSPKPPPRRTPRRRATATTHSSTEQRKQKCRRGTMSPPGRRKSPRGPRNSLRVATASTTTPKAAAIATASRKKTKKNISGNKRKRTRRHGNVDDNDEDPNSENNDDSDNTNSVVEMIDTPLTKRKKSVPNKYEAQWNEMYGRLLQYKNKNHGSTSVPRKFDDDPCLGSWVNNQRCCNNTATLTLTAERKTRLNSIGFVWNPHEALWEEMFNRLFEYKKQFKHTCVPKRYEADLVLANWVQNQRRSYRYKLKCLTKKRIEHLEDLGFQWVSTARKEKYDAL